MTELLSREKEFLKLNEQLDKLTTTAIELQEFPYQNVGSNALTSPRGKLDTHYHTYTKSKGPSTLMKKRGAGDGNTPALALAPAPAPHTEHHRHSARHGSKTTSLKPNSTTTATIPSPHGHSGLSEGNGSPAPPAEGGRKELTIPPTSVSHRKSVKSDSSTRTFSRTSNRILSNTATFTVKYRNPKFVQSPSLEVLIKEESAAIKERSLIPTEVDSNISSTTDSGTSSRRSQVSTARKQISTEGLIKFLKSKITILEEDHDRITEEMNQQKELLEKTLEQHKKVEQQRDQSYQKQSALAEQLNKAESQLQEVNRCMKERITDQCTQQKELELAKRELKLLTQTNANLEKRLFRATEELANTKNTLTQLKTLERDLKETNHADNEAKDKQIKSLKQQRADLLNAYKKQIFLIDNLKRQNVCIEQAKMISYGEREFTQVLDWNTKP